MNVSGASLRSRARRSLNRWWYVPGERILTIPELAKEQVYPMRLKGICVCFSMLKSALCGNYVNFGGFRLYGDEALDNALRTFVKLLLSVPHSDLLVSCPPGARQPRATLANEMAETVR